MVVMFISKKEKDEILKRLTELEIKLRFINGFIEFLQEKDGRKKRTMSPENRAKISRRMKEWHAKRKAEKGVK